MKRSYLLFICTVLSFFARGQQRLKYVNGDPGCIENKNLYEELLQVTPADEAEYTRQDSFKKYPYYAYLNGSLDCYNLAIIRGLVDTTLMRPDHLKKFPQLSENARTFLPYSPLIIEGEVEEVLNADTASQKFYHYKTIFIIKVKDVIASKYKIKTGDYVVARTQLYGYSYSPYYKEVFYQFPSELNLVYRKGKTYLFVFDKYDYMNFINRHFTPDADEYCPYSFDLGFSEHELSEEYVRGELTKKDIKAFLKKK